MKAQLDKVLELLDINDLDISINNTRCTFPTAYYYPQSKRVIIHANKPSLIRLALAYLVIHEKAHDTYIGIMDGEEMEDHHMDPIFKEIVTEYERKVDEITGEEFD